MKFLCRLGRHKWSPWWQYHGKAVLPGVQFSRCYVCGKTKLRFK